MKRRKNGVYLALEYLEERTAPAVLMVNSLADGAISGLTPTLSLREAVALVDSAGLVTDASGNSLAAAKASQITGSFGSDDTIEFDSTLFNGGPQTIGLDPTQGQLSITAAVTINNSFGADMLAISGNNSSRVFEIESGTTAAISGLTIEGGNEFNQSGGLNLNLGGGAIKNYGNLTVATCTFSKNAGNNGAAIENGDFSGPSGGQVTITDCTFSDNNGMVGTVSNNSGDLKVANSTFHDNTESYTITTINGNVSDDGFLMWVEAGTGTVSNCTIAFNRSAGVGAGSANAAITVSNCTIANNESDGIAGLMLNGRWTTTVNNSIVANNQ